MKTVGLALMALVASLLASPSDEAKCHSACVSCRVRCKQRSDDVRACIDTCLELKRACCEACGAGPGPRTTCSCT